MTTYYCMRQLLGNTYNRTFIRHMTATRKSLRSYKRVWRLLSKRMIRRRLKHWKMREMLLKRKRQLGDVSYRSSIPISSSLRKIKKKSTKFWPEACKQNKNVRHIMSDTNPWRFKIKIKKKQDCARNSRFKSYNTKTYLALAKSSSVTCNTRKNSVLVKRSLMQVWEDK